MTIISKGSVIGEGVIEVIDEQRKMLDLKVAFSQDVSRFKIGEIIKWGLLETTCLRKPFVLGSSISIFMYPEIFVGNGIVEEFTSDSTKVKIKFTSVLRLKEKYEVGSVHEWNVKFLDLQEKIPLKK